MTKNELMDDLKEIRYYYSRKMAMAGSESRVVAERVLEKIERYNAVVRKAPIRIYDVYVSLYVENNTQESLAFKWGYDVVTEL